MLCQEGYINSWTFLQEVPGTLYEKERMLLWCLFNAMSVILHDHLYPRVFLHMQGMRMPGIFLLLVLRFLCYCVCMTTLPNWKQKENRRRVQHHWTTQVIRFILMQCFLYVLRHLENVQLKKKSVKRKTASR